MSINESPTQRRLRMVCVDAHFATPAEASAFGAFMESIGALRIRTELCGSVWHVAGPAYGGALAYLVGGSLKHVCICFEDGDGVRGRGPLGDVWGIEPTGTLLVYRANVDTPRDLAVIRRLAVTRPSSLGLVFVRYFGEEDEVKGGRFLHALEVESRGFFALVAGAALGGGVTAAGRFWARDGDNAAFRGARDFLWG